MSTLVVPGEADDLDLITRKHRRGLEPARRLVPEPTIARLRLACAGHAGASRRLGRFPARFTSERRVRASCESGL